MINRVSFRIDSFAFDAFVDTLLLILAFVYMCSEMPRNETLIFYFCVCLLEMLLKFVVKGSYRYIHSKRTLTDGVLTICLFVVIVVVTATESEKNNSNFNFIDNFTVRLLLILRVLFFPRNILLIERLKGFRQQQKLLFEATFKSLNHIFFLVLVIFSCMYCFASIGLVLLLLLLI